MHSKQMMFPVHLVCFRGYIVFIQKPKSVATLNFLLFVLLHDHLHRANFLVVVIVNQQTIFNLIQLQYSFESKSHLEPQMQPLG